ncbi:MAG: hypothetical protein DMD43_10290 [Gemmatimonadetes bacterium]|nr:MAG: hypothetical protein DMD43_10290 [Gemmatimonadota bacterium]
MRTVEDDRADLTAALSRLGNYLGLVALVALLLGGLGVASAVHVFIKRKLDTIAVLRCLGATSLEVFTVYLLQALVMGAIGSGVGALLGVGLQQVLPMLFRGLLPVDVRVAPSPRSILLGTGLGLWVAGIFAALPLVAIRRRRSRRARPRPAGVAFQRPARAERGGAGVDPGGAASRRGVFLDRGGRGAPGALARGTDPHQGGAALVPDPVAVPLAPGARQPLPPGQPDGDRGARARVRRVSPLDALPGAAQPPSPVPARRVARAAQPHVLRHPARAAGRGRDRARGGRSPRIPDGASSPPTPRSPRRRVAGAAAAARRGAREAGPLRGLSGGSTAPPGGIR